MQTTQGVEREVALGFRFKDEGAEDVTFPGPHPQIGKAQTRSLGNNLMCSVCGEALKPNHQSEVRTLQWLYHYCVVFCEFCSED